MSIETIDLVKKAIISSRVNHDSNYISSISIDHSTAMTVVVSPLINSLSIMNQKLSSIVKGPTTNILGYGDFDFPICARIDSLRNSIWIADTGNNSIVKTNLSLEFVLSIDDITFPYCIQINPNNGNIFVRHYTGQLDTISYFSKSGEKLWSIFTDAILPDFSQTENYIESLPLQNSIKTDHVRNTCWISSQDNIIKVNLWANNSSTFPISKYISIKEKASIDIDYDSGNPKIFVTESQSKQRTGIIELSENNDTILSYNTIDRTKIKCGVDIIPPSTTTSQLLLQGFKNPMARSIWNKYIPNRPDNAGWYKSSIAPFDIENPVIRMPWFAYGSFEKDQIFATGYMHKKSATNVTDVWRYVKDKSITTLYNGIHVDPSEISGLYRLNLFHSPIGNVNPFPNDYGYVIESGKYAACNCDYDITSPEYDSYYATFPYKGFN